MTFVILLVLATWLVWMWVGGWLVMIAAGIAAPILGTPTVSYPDGVRLLIAGALVKIALFGTTGTEFRRESSR